MGGMDDTRPREASESLHQGQASEAMWILNKRMKRERDLAYEDMAAAMARVLEPRPPLTRWQRIRDRLWWFWRFHRPYLHFGHCSDRC